MNLKTTAFCFITLTTCAHAAPPTTENPANDVSGSVHIANYLKHGYGCDWEPAGHLRVAYEAVEKDGYLDVHTTNPDGSADACLTCRHPQLPNRHIGAPKWHPKGAYLAVTVEKARHPGGSSEATPSYGGPSDIVLISSDGAKTWPLTAIPNDIEHGILPASFSPDGQRMAWSERTKRPDRYDSKKQASWWTIKVADVRIDAKGPRIENIKELIPNSGAFYEAFGFSPDGKRLLFCSNTGQAEIVSTHIFTMDSRTGADIRQLTDDGINQNAAFTRDGRFIVWATDVGNKAGTDWWIMRADGSEKKRLTGFNLPKHAHNDGDRHWVGTPSFNPAGTRFIGGVSSKPSSHEGKIVAVDMPPQFTPGR